MSDIAHILRRRGRAAPARRYAAQAGARSPGSAILDPVRILVTGGTSGLGWAMARALAVAGSSVALTGRSGERARQVAADLPGAIGLPLDVRSESSVAAAVQEAWSRLGGVDMLVNNAGIGMRTVNPSFMTEPQGFWRVSAAGFRDVIETNLTGYFLMAREITPRMLAAGTGRIVNVSVNHATMTGPASCPTGRPAPVPRRCPG